MTNVFTQRRTETSGTVAYDVSTADIWLFFDTSSLIASITIPFPESPDIANDQTFGLSFRSGVTLLTLTSDIPISGESSTAVAGSQMSWTYNEASNRWFRTS